MNRYMFYKVKYKKVWEDIKKKILYIKKIWEDIKKKEKTILLIKKYFIRTNYVIYNILIKNKRK